MLWLISIPPTGRFNTTNHQNKLTVCGYNLCRCSYVDLEWIHSFVLCNKVSGPNSPRAFFYIYKYYCGLRNVQSLICHFQNCTAELSPFFLPRGSNLRSWTLQHLSCLNVHFPQFVLNCLNTKMPLKG